MLNKEMESGSYWIDPNGSSSKDAILVHCDKELLATCLISQPDEFNSVTITNVNGSWLSDSDKSYQFSYKSDSNQIRFMQMLSTNVWQNITLDLKANKNIIKLIEQ